MGWSVHIQIVRDRPLDAKERKQLAVHARKFKLSRRSETYDFRVAPEDAPGGVVAEALGKFGFEANPDEDEDTARLYAALTELRGLFADASLEVADDLALVGWDGERYDVVDDPDQEMTPAPRDQSGWLTVPAPAAPRTRAAPKASAKRTKKTGPLDDAIAAVAGGRPIEGDDATLRELVLLAFAGMEKAEKANDGERRKQITEVLAALPARVVVDAGLEVRWLIGPTVGSIGAALERLESLEDFRYRVLAVWFGGIPGKDGGELWNRMSFGVMEAVIRDRHVVGQLGGALLQAKVAGDRASLYIRTTDLLAKTASGMPYVIARRRADRAAAEPPRLEGPMLRSIASNGCRETLPTAVLELARPGVDRDELLRELGRIDDARVQPILERALATDQYTRAVTRALLRVPGQRAEELLAGLTTHIDPFVRICAAQGLVARRGADAVRGLLEAIGHARAAGIWNEGPPGNWANTFNQLDEARKPVRELWHSPAWPEALKTAAIPEVVIAADEDAAAPVRMLSMNPDVRRDAIELVHAAALRDRDPSRLRMLAIAERWHHALCARADLPMTDSIGGCTRVSLTNYWASWRKRARMPFDPAYRYREVTWNWLDAHADEVATQVIPDELAAIASATPPAHPELRLRFDAAELAACDEAERVFAAQTEHGPFVMFQ